MSLQSGNLPGRASDVAGAANYPPRRPCASAPVGYKPAAAQSCGYRRRSLPPNRTCCPIPCMRIPAICVQAKRRRSNSICGCGSDIAIQPGPAIRASTAGQSMNCPSRCVAVRASAAATFQNASSARFATRLIPQRYATILPASRLAKYASRLSRVLQSTRITSHHPFEAASLTP